MKLFRQLYLNDLLFIALGGCSAVFFASYAYAPLFYIGLSLLGVVILLLLADLVLLFRTQQVEGSRNMSPVLSLGDQNALVLQLQNLTQRSIRLRIIDELPYQFNERDLQFSVDVKAGGSETLRYHLVPPVRGEYEFGRVHVFVRTAIGLASKRESIDSGRSVAVYPSLIQMAQQELAAISNPSFTQGGNLNRRQGQSYEFDRIKQYVAGDDPRHINWKATSAMGDVMVNSYEDERSQPVYALVDKSRVMRMPFNGLTLMDHAINTTLAFSNIVLKKQDKAGLILFSKTVSTFLKADRGPLQLKKIMYRLYKEKYDYAEASYEALYSSIRRNIPNRSLLFLYTNFDSLYALQRNIAILRLINRHHLLVVVFFENTELEAYSREEADSLLAIYQMTIAKKLMLEKSQVYRELQKHGIQAIECKPEHLSTATINKYLELKSRGTV